MKNVYVLIGGWTRSQSSYKKLVSCAPPDCEIICVPYKVIDRKNVAKSLNNYLTFKKIGKFNLIGHSLGGAIAIDFISKFPDLVNNLYLVDSEGIYGNEKSFKLLLNFLKTRVLHGRKLITRDLASLYSVLLNPFFHFNLAKYAHFANFVDELKLIKKPTIIIWGEKDHIAPVWQGQSMNKLIPNSKLVILAGMDHDWILHSPEKFWRIV